MKYPFLLLLLLVFIISISSFFVEIYLNELGHTNAKTVSSILTSTLLILSVYIGIRKGHIQLRLNKPITRSEIVNALLLALGLAIFFKIFFVPFTGVEAYIRESKAMPIIDLLYFLAILVVPIVEELFFRKLICDLMIKEYKFFKTILLSAVIFMCAHVLSGTGNLTAILISGLFLSYVYLKTGKLFLVILIHSIMNVLDYPLLYWTGLVLEKNLFTVDFASLYYLIFLVLASVIVYFGFSYFKRLPKL